MKKKILIAGLYIFSGLSVWGQNPAQESAVCSEKIVEKVASRGIKVGAKIDEILDVFASTEEEKKQIRNNGSGSRRTNIGYEFFGASPKPDDKRFEGIGSYAFSFLDGQLEGFSVYYIKPAWKDVDQFTDTIVAQLDLPDVKYWNKQNNVSNNLQCGNYSIQISLGGTGGSLQINNLQLTRILEQREQKLREETREKDIKAFKP